jgi:single-strand DNA-binding protein
MLNQIVLVGRIVRDVEKKEVDGKTYAELELAVQRSYKNENGEYDTDFVDCLLWGGIAENVAEYCKKGDLVGIKGRIQTEIVEDHKTTNVIAEKVTFLSSKGKEDE